MIDLLAVHYAFATSHVAIWDSRFRPSTYLLPAWLELDRRYVRKGGIAGRLPTLFPAHARTPSIDRHSGQWRTQNVAKRPGEGPTEGAWPGMRNGRSAPGRRAGASPCPLPHVGRLWTTSRRRGRTGTQNGVQQLGLRRHSTPVKMQMWRATRGRDCRPGSMGYPRPAVGYGRTISQNLSALSRSL